MKTQCQIAVTDALKKITGDPNRKATKAELDGIETRIRGALREMSMNDHDNFAARTASENMHEAVKLAREKMLQDMVDAHQRAIMEAQTRSATVMFLHGVKAGVRGKTVALMQRLFYDAGNRSDATSVEINRKAIFNNFMRHLTDLSGYDDGKFLGMLQDPEKQHALLRALHGETTDPEAARAAQVIQKALDVAVKRYRSVGIPLHPNENWRVPQPQDPYKLAGDREGWIDDHMGWVDRRAYLNADGTLKEDHQLRTFLGEAWHTLVSDGAVKRARESEPTGGSGLVGASANKPRQLWFKDSDSYIAAMQKYGRTTNVYELMSNHFNRMANDIAIAQSMGRDAHANFRHALDIAQAGDTAAAKTPRERDKLKSLRTLAERQWEAMVAPEQPGSELWARRHAMVRAVMSTSQLGGLFSALPDVAMLKLHANALGIPEMQVYATALKMSLSGKRGALQMQALGLAHEGFGHAVDRFSYDNYHGKLGNFLNDAVHRLAGLNALDRGLKGGMGMGIMRLFGGLTREHALVTALQTGDHALLSRKGITQEHWDIWRAAGTDENGMLTPAQIDRMSDADLIPLITQRLAARSQDYADAIQSRRDRNAQLDETLKSRWDKLNILRDAGNRRLRELDERRQAKLDKHQEVNDAHAELLRATMEHAEVEHDIAAYLKTADTQEKMLKYLREVEDGESIERGTVFQRDWADRRSDAVVERASSTPGVGEKADRAVEGFGRSINTAGEALGYRRRSVMARIKEAQIHADKFQKAHDVDVLGRAKDLETKHRGLLSDFKKTAEDFRQQAARREEIAKAFQKKLGPALMQEMDKARDEATEKLLAVAFEEMQTGARGGMGASIKERVGAGLDKLPAGTFAGEVARYFWHMKATPLGIFRTHFMDAPMKLDGWKAQWGYRAKFIAYSTVMGALAVQLKHMANGEDPEDMKTPGFWAYKSLTAGGGLGIYGDLFMHDASKSGMSDILSTIAGPMANAVTSAGRELNAAKVAAEKGETKHDFGVAALSIFRKNAVPFMNIWYAKAAFNHLVYENLQDMIQPGYSDKRAKRMADNFGTSYWWGPDSDNRLPQRAPDLSAAFPTEE